MKARRYTSNVVNTCCKCFEAYKRDQASSSKYTMSTKNNVIVNDNGNDNESYEMQELDTFEGYFSRVHMQKLELDL